MSTEFTVTVKLADPFDNVLAEQVQEHVERALRNPDAGLLGLDVQVSSVQETVLELSRSLAWAWLVGAGMEADNANDVLNTAERDGSWTGRKGSHHIEISVTDRGKFTVRSTRSAR